ncbi:MAG: hypothetical protein M1832_002341 [Thelocarpon impressellum]|nr:MAG: hypothetical protein M1832_002341 [Thelocarpon impressellum]
MSVTVAQVDTESTTDSGSSGRSRSSFTIIGTPSLRSPPATPASETKPKSILYSTSDLDDPKRRSIQFPPAASTTDMPRNRRPRDSEDNVSLGRADETTSMVGRGRAPTYGGSDDTLRNSGSLRARTHEQEQAAEAAEATKPDDDKPEGWWRWFADKYGSVELENKGSTARDHLALERTFLAWLRTSLAFASIGIAITQLFRLNTTIVGRDPEMQGAVRLRGVGKPLGSTFLAIAIVVLFVGFRRYFESQFWIIRGKFPASRGSVFLVFLIAALLIVGSLVVVVVMDSSAFET